MPVKIPSALPARQVLQNENIFVMASERADSQDIRPLKLAILNLMPSKIITETQLLRLLGNTPLQVEVTFLQTGRVGTHTPAEHMQAFYRYFDDVSTERFDGLIITGAPVETLPFEEVSYWDELRSIMDWANRHVFSTLFICWAAQAGMYHFHGVPKYPLEKKMFGVFPHTKEIETSRLMRGLDDVFYAPHSRHTDVRREDIEKHDDLQILATSEQAGVLLAANKNRRQVYITGHMEYDADTLAREYERDIAKGMEMDVPANYYIDDDPAKGVRVTWRSTGHILMANWLNYYVYQETPYDLEVLKALL